MAEQVTLTAEEVEADIAASEKTKAAAIAKELKEFEAKRVADLAAHVESIKAEEAEATAKAEAEAK